MTGSQTTSKKWPFTASAPAVVIVNFNAGSLLCDSVSAVLAQSEEIIVVDNASTDNSLDLLAAAFSGENALKVIQNSENLGFATACNIGMRHANPQRNLLFLNPDCVMQPGACSRLGEVLDAYPAAGMVGGLLLNLDGTEQGGGRRAVPTPWRSFVRAFGLSRFANRWPRLFFDFHLHKQPLPNQPIEVEAISGACMLIRREAMDAVGQWDEGYFLHCEDLDLSMTLRQKGWTIMFVPDARVFHDKGSSSRSRPVFVEWHKHRGMMRFYRKFFGHRYPGALMWLVAFGVWSRFAAVATYYTVLRAARTLGMARG